MEEIRNHIIQEVYALLEEHDGEFHQNCSQRTYDKIDEIDRVICAALGLEKSKVCHHSEV